MVSRLDSLKFVQKKSPSFPWEFYRSPGISHWISALKHSPVHNQRQTHSQMSALTAVLLQSFCFAQRSGWNANENERLRGDNGSFQLYVKQSSVTHAEDLTCWQRWWGLGTDITHLLHMWADPYTCIKARTYICAITAPVSSSHMHTHMWADVYSAGMADLGLNRELNYKLSTTTTWKYST